MFACHIIIQVNIIITSNFTSNSLSGQDRLQTHWGPSGVSTQSAPKRQPISSHSELTVLSTSDVQPLAVSVCSGSTHVSHLCPCTPGLHTHRPVICSQSSRTEPSGEHPQAVHNSHLSLIANMFHCWISDFIYCLHHWRLLLLSEWKDLKSSYTDCMQLLCVPSGREGWRKRMGLFFLEKNAACMLFAGWR